MKDFLTLRSITLLTLFLWIVWGCGPSDPPAELPHILLVTLDTTRADSMGYENKDARTPHIDALAAQGTIFDQAYAAAPMTLPSHVSMFSGLYPCDTGIHQNARYLQSQTPLFTTHLKKMGYHTAAFLSGFPLNREFGLNRGFDVYDDDFGEKPERSAADTTDRILSYLRNPKPGPVFIWAHYYDPHAPYSPPQPYKDQFPDRPYFGEVAYMDAHLGRLLDAFHAQFGQKPHRVILVGDHGEALGDHGEPTHGILMYQSVMRVPLVIAGSGIQPQRIRQPVSIRRIYHTILSWVGQEENANSLMVPPNETVMAEAMKPFLQYGWSPQVMAVEQHLKVIKSVDFEMFNPVEDPEERHDLFPDQAIPAPILDALESYPLPSQSLPDLDLDADQRERLASLGYLSSSFATTLDLESLPNPRDMTHLFEDLRAGNRALDNKEFDRAIRIFSPLMEQDPNNLIVLTGVALSHSMLGHSQEADALFARALEIDPTSLEVHVMLGRHLQRTHRFDLAADQFESVLAIAPRKAGTLYDLGVVRKDQGQFQAATACFEKAAELRPNDHTIFLHLGDLYMAVRNTIQAIAAFETAERIQRDGFVRNLDLGVCYQAQKRYEEAKVQLEKVAPESPDYPMALFKRAQVAVQSGEPNAEIYIQTALQNGDTTTTDLIHQEPIFNPFGF